MDIDEEISRYKYLNNDQKNDLRDSFDKYEKLFNGKLGLYPHKKVHIKVEPNIKLAHNRPYTVPNIHLDTFKKELFKEYNGSVTYTHLTKKHYVGNICCQ